MVHQDTTPPQDTGPLVLATALLGPLVLCIGVTPAHAVVPDTGTGHLDLEVDMSVTTPEEEQSRGIPAGLPKGPGPDLL